MIYLYQLTQSDFAISRWFYIHEYAKFHEYKNLAKISQLTVSWIQNNYIITGSLFMSVYRILSDLSDSIHYFRKFALGVLYPEHLFSLCCSLA